jgi:hypothetical protein
VSARRGEWAAPLVAVAALLWICQGDGGMVALCLGLGMAWAPAVQAATAICKIATKLIRDAASR